MIHNLSPSSELLQKLGWGRDPINHKWNTCIISRRCHLITMRNTFVIHLMVVSLTNCIVIKCNTDPSLYFVTLLLLLKYSAKRGRQVALLFKTSIFTFTTFLFFQHQHGIFLRWTESCGTFLYHCLLSFNSWSGYVGRQEKEQCRGSEWRGIIIPIVFCKICSINKL